MPTPSTEVYEFGDFRLDVAEHRLGRVDDGPVAALSEKPFQTLLYLVRNHGHLVTKADLLDAVWRDAIVEENNLDKSVHAIRQVLGDKPGGTRYIETVRKHGYRFIAEVKAVDPEWQGGAESEPDADMIGPLKDPIPFGLSRSGAHAIVGLEEWKDLAERFDLDTNPRPLTGQIKEAQDAEAESSLAAEPKWTILKVAVGVLLLSALSGLLLYVFNRRSVPTAKSHTLLVLPVRSMDPAARDDLLEIGIADSLIHALGSNRNVVVRPLRASRLYLNADGDPQNAGREQRVDLVLEANYQVSENRYRITGRLIDTVTGGAVQNFKVDTDSADRFAVQDKVAAELSQEIFRALSLVDERPEVKRGTLNEQAYRLYLEARYLYGRRNLSAAKKAVDLLDEAVRLDPNYALAWAAKSHAHRYAGNLGRDTDTHAEYQRSIAAAERALAIDDKLSEAYSAICENKLYYEFDFSGAEQNCLKAIELDPNSSLAHEVYGRFLTHRGRFDEGISEIKTAIDLDPTSLFNQRNLGIAFYYAGRYEEAEDQLKRVISMDASFMSAYMWLRNTYEIQGRFPEAFECLMKAQRAAEAEAEVIKRYEAAYKKGGYQAVLREHAKFHENYNQFYVSAILHAQIGEFEKAFEYLEISYQRREWGMNSLLIEPHLRPLHGDPRFERLIERVGLRGN